MLLAKDILIDLLTERRGLYERLGLLDEYVTAMQKSPAFGTALGNSVTMNEPIEELEGRIADVNRRIARVRGPIPDKLAFDLS